MRLIRLRDMDHKDSASPEFAPGKYDRQVEEVHEVKSGCPDIETVAGLADGMLLRRGQLRAWLLATIHIRGCDSCKDLVECVRPHVVSYPWGVRLRSRWSPTEWTLCGSAAAVLLLMLGWWIGNYFGVRSQQHSALELAAARQMVTQATAKKQKVISEAKRQVQDAQQKVIDARKSEQLAQEQALEASQRANAATSQAQNSQSHLAKLRSEWSKMRARLPERDNWGHDSVAMIIRSSDFLDVRQMARSISELNPERDDSINRGSGSASKDTNPILLSPSTVPSMEGNSSQPVDANIVSDRPWLRCFPVEGAAGYQFTIYTSRDEPIESGRSAEPKWRPEKPLPRNNDYKWTVTANFPDGTQDAIRSLPARFHVVDQTKADAITSLHMILGERFRKARLFAEAAQEYQMIPPDYPIYGGKAQAWLRDMSVKPYVSLKNRAH